MHAAQQALRAPPGSVAAAAGAVRWTFDAEARMRTAAVHRRSMDDHLRLSKQRNERVKR
jgi:hypothetical protein